MTNSRNKGANGEREFIRLINEQLGMDAARNLAQYRESGCDVIGVPGWSIEIKRRQVLSLRSWWTQAVANAEEDTLPALAYRMNRKPWKIIVPLQSMMFIDSDQTWNFELTAELSIIGFCEVIRSQL